jgi:hypothetical protein
MPNLDTLEAQAILDELSLPQYAWVEAEQKRLGYHSLVDYLSFLMATQGPFMGMGNSDRTSMVVQIYDLGREALARHRADMKDGGLIRPTWSPAVRFGHWAEQQWMSTGKAPAERDVFAFCKEQFGYGRGRALELWRALPSHLRHERG